MTRMIVLRSMAALAAALSCPAASSTASVNGADSGPVWGGELRFAIHSEPKTWDPLMSSDDASVTVRYLTSGFLVRLNRKTQKLEPEIAESWKVLDNGKKIVFELRPGVRFSDGAALTAEDVAASIRRVLDPAMHSPLGDVLRASGDPVLTGIPGPGRVAVTFPAAVPDPAGLFDSLAILPANVSFQDNTVKNRPGLGPFQLGEYKAGSYIVLKRNPNYWRPGTGGRRLPYLDSLHLDIQSNRDIEFQRFRRGEFHLMEWIDATQFTSIAAEMGASAALDLGPAFENEMLWFNQKPDAPMPEYKKEWFRSRNFRRAIAESLHLDDIVKLVYQGRATPAAGIVSRANQFWLKQGLQPHHFDPVAARKRLADDGFKGAPGQPLTDRSGHVVEFSLVTSSGSKVRARTAAILQDDLAQLGIKLNIASLDFPSLLERIGRTGNYEAALLGFVGEDLDPSGGANAWLSHAAQHMWNPNQPRPATPWEAEIDKLIAIQASTADVKKRKAAFDQVQQIIWDEVPVIHLVNRNALAAVSPRLKNIEPAAMNPHLFWNVESLYLAPEKRP